MIWPKDGHDLAESSNVEVYSKNEDYLWLSSIDGEENRVCQTSITVEWTY